MVCAQMRSPPSFPPPLQQQPTANSCPRYDTTRQDAAHASPASVAAAITVGASGTADFKESYSNWGSLVDIYAPGGKCV